jgi:hypothetical protein
MAFVLHDAGETRALMPVMSKLDMAGVDYVVLAESTAKGLLLHDPHRVPSAAEMARAEQNAPRLAAWMKQQWNRALHASLCVTGLSSDFQKRWADFFRQNGRRVVGYYDGFGFRLNRENNPVSGFQASLTDLITPTADSAEHFKRQGFGHIPVSALGQPTLESIPAAMNQSNPSLLTQQLVLTPGKPTILFVGQYGADYEQAFALFCQTAAQLPNANLLVSLHPKANGEFETRMIQQFGLQGKIQILPKELATEQALLVADMVLTNTSTMATQAFLQGEKVIFVGPKKADLYEPLQARGLAPRCLTPESLVTAVHHAMQAEQATLPSQSQLYSLLGIPHAATERITAYLLSLLPPKQANPISSETL